MLIKKIKVQYLVGLALIVLAVPLYIYDATVFLAAIGSLLFLFVPIHLPFFQKFISGVFVFLTSVIFINHLFEILNISISVVLASLMTYLIFVIASVFVIKSYSLPKTSYQDVFSLLIISVIFTFLCLPLLKSSGTGTFSYLRNGEDNNSQYQMYNYVATTGHVNYGKSLNNHEIRYSLKSYPQGSHIAAAVITQPFFKHAQNLNQRLKLYVLSFAFLYAATIFFAYTAISIVVRKLKPKKDDNAVLWDTTIGILITTTLGFGVFLSLYTYGFFGQIACYAFLAFTIAMVATTEQRVTNRLQPFVVFLAALLGLFGVITTWYLLAPIAALMVFVLILKFRNEYFKYRLLLSSIGIVFILVSSMTLYNFIFSKYSGGGGHIFTTGGVEKMSKLLLIIPIAMAPLGLYYLKQKKWFETGIITTALASSLFAILIGFAQKYKIGHLDYYFYKSIFTTILITFIGLGYVYMSQIASGVKNRYAIKYVYACSAAFLLILALANPMQSAIDFKNTKYNSSQTTATALSRAVNSPDLYNAKNDVLVLGSCAGGYDDFIGTIWAGSINLTYNKQRSEFENNLIIDNNDGSLAREIIKYQKNNRDGLTILKIGECRNIILDQLRGIPEIRVISLS